MSKGSVFPPWHRTNTVSVRLTKAEKKALEAMAKSVGTTPAFLGYHFIKQGINETPATER